MEFTVQRSTSEAGEFPTYALVDSNGATLLQADQSQGPPPESRRQIRMVRPGGRLVATIDIPQVNATVVDEEQRQDYAIIHEYAVYAIISVLRRSETENNGDSETYYVLEVEGEIWLLLPHPEDNDCYALYDDAPVGLHTYDALAELDLPSDIGRFCRNEDQESLDVQLETTRLVHTDMVVLALALLVDQSGKRL